MSDCWHYKKFLPFRRFKKAVRKLGITSQAEFLSRYKEIPGAPSNPREIYWGKGWKGQPDLFGRKRKPSGRPKSSKNRKNGNILHSKRKKFLSFSKFRAVLHSLKIKSWAEYKSRYKEISGAPSDPCTFYHRDRRRFGLYKQKFLSFDEFKNKVRALGITVTDEYHLRYKEIPGAPSCPEYTYKKNGWKGFRDLFGRPRRSAKDHAEARKARYKLFILKYKQEHPCMDCGESDPVCLDFHHRDPSIKSFEIARGVKCRSLEAVQAEIAKCDVVCANCHRKRHAKEVIPFPRQTLREIHRPAERPRKQIQLPLAA